jgi:hypothetical protein
MLSLYAQHPPFADYGKAMVRRLRAEPAWIRRDGNSA